MNTRSHLFICLLALSLIASPISGQQPKPKAPGTTKPASTNARDKPEKKVAETVTEKNELTPQQERSLLLLEQAATEAASLSDKRAIAKLQTAAADALWPQRPDKARELFHSALEFAARHYRETGDDNREQINRSSYINKPDQMLEVIRLARQRDAALGDELAEKYIAEKQRAQEERRNKADKSRTRPGNPLFGTDERSGAELIEVAKSLMSVDEKSAGELARKAVTLGVTPETIKFLAEVAAKDRAKADGLFLLALDRVAQEQNPHPGQLLLLAAYAFGERDAVAASGNGMARYWVGLEKDFAVSGQLVRRFAAVAFAALSQVAVMASGAAGENNIRYETGLFAVRYLAPKIEKYQPALLPDWRELDGRLTQLVAENKRLWIEKQSAEKRSEDLNPQPATDPSEQIKSQLAEAQKTTDLKRRNHFYQNAAQEALSAGDFAQALDIVDLISDLTDQMKLRSWISFTAAEKLLRENKADEARRYALNVDEADQRAWLFMEIARTALKANNQARATELLEEALKYVSAADNTPARIRAFSGIVQTLAGFDVPRAFNAAADLVSAINRLKEPLPDRAMLVRAYETVGNSRISSQDVAAFDPGGTLALLAREDFERALTLAQSVENSQVRLSSVIAVAASSFARKKSGQ
ncbi:MAG: hypothetical protein U0Z53_32075 [Blastocatellia bacterium]